MQHRFTAENAAEMRQRSVAARLRKKQIRDQANELARKFLCQNPRAQLGIDLGVQLRVLHDVVLTQLSKVIGGGKGVIERLHGLIQVERELVDLLNESNLEKNKLPGDIERLVNQDPEVAKAGFEEAVRLSKDDIERIDKD